MNDLDAVTQIDSFLLGHERRGYWEDRIERSQKSGVPSLVAEDKGKVVGFILGNASGWEHGIPDNVGWIDTIGVRKDYQKKGIGRILFNEMRSMFKKVGIDTIYLFVNWRQWDLLEFFDKMQFKRGDMINLELKI